MPGILEEGLKKKKDNPFDPNQLTPGNTIPGTSVTADGTPAVRRVDPGETVQGQLSGIMAADSPFLQQARGRAAQVANDRGLLNSSIAAQAGESAAYDAALPVANADAQTYKSAGDLNFGAQNQFGIARFNEGAQSRLMNQQARENLNVETAVQNLRGTQAKELAQLEAQYRQFVQATDSTSRIFAQASQDIKDILVNPDIPAENKQAIVDKHIQLLRAALTVQGGINNLDLQGLLTFEA